MKSRAITYSFLCMRLLLGTVFIAASIDKIAHPSEFAKIVLNYQTLPGYLINIVAIVLPWLEALLGLFILCGWWLPGATVVANLLLVAFFGALAQAVARGIDLTCGCFSVKAAGSPHTVWYLARDSLFLLLGTAVTIQVFRARSAGTKKSDA
ncbi:MAG: MauE/DoxX family redox-associated membrane protein [Syntrophobacteraceae bacterium]|jgi:uncharacterized membrane protein YphA (DoxX/SURF4 family)